MGWLGWLFLFAGLYVVVIAIRGGIQLVSWLVEEYFSDPRSASRPKEESSSQSRVTKRLTATTRRKKKLESAGTTTRDSRAPSPVAIPARRPSRLGQWLRRLKTPFLGKRYDYWVAAALAEDDLELRVRYLSKALAMNPAYLPAWGMKGNTLFDLGRYDEALECFNKSLELHPSSLVCYKKAICFHRGGRRDEALRCLGEAVEICPSQDRQLVDDIARMRSLLEAELRTGGRP